MLLIAIGANLPGPDGRPPLETCRWAAFTLDRLPGLHLRALSRWYLSEPMPPSGQPLYFNAVAVLGVEAGGTEPDPSVLLATLHEIEAEAGRVRGELNAARTLDLDLIAMGQGGQMVRAFPDPVLPHPRAHERAFVLRPLLDVAPDWSHPVLRRTVGDLLTDLPPQGIYAV
jgi:2-amino-4-hydroxy-6-hydroxymethyldihydropteridine diphosphokinase